MGRDFVQEYIFQFKVILKIQIDKEETARDWLAASGGEISRSIITLAVR